MKQISMTIPDAIHAALKAEGQTLEQEPGDVLKTFLLQAYKQEGGAMLNLKPAAADKPDPNQAELPLQ